MLWGCVSPSAVCRTPASHWSETHVPGMVASAWPRAVAWADCRTTTLLSHSPCIAAHVYHRDVSLRLHTLYAMLCCIPTWILGLKALGLRSRIASTADCRTASLSLLLKHVTQLQLSQYLPLAKHSQYLHEPGQTLPALAQLPLQEQFYICDKLWPNHLLKRPNARFNIQLRLVAWLPLVEEVPTDCAQSLPPKASWCSLTI